MLRAMTSCSPLTNVWCQTAVLLVLHSALFSVACNLAPYTELNSWQNNGLYVQHRCKPNSYIFGLNLYMTRQSSCMSSANVGDRLCNYTLAREPCNQQSLQWMVNFTSPPPTCLPPRSVIDHTAVVKEFDEASLMVTRLAQWHSVLLAARRQEPMVPVFVLQMFPVAVNPSRCPNTYTHGYMKGLSTNATFSGYSSVSLQEGHDSCATFELDLTRDNGCNVTAEMVRLYRNNSLLPHTHGDVTLSVDPVVGNFIYNFSVCFVSPIEATTAGRYTLALYVPERYVSRYRYVEQTLLHDFTVHVKWTAVTVATHSATSGLNTKYSSNTISSVSHGHPSRPSTQYQIKTQLPRGHINATPVYTENTTDPGYQTTLQSRQHVTSTLPAKQSITAHAAGSTGQAHSSTNMATVPTTMASFFNNTIYISSGSSLVFMAIVIALLAFVLRRSWCKSRHLPSRRRRFTGITSVKKPCNGLQLAVQSTSVSTLLRHQPSTPSCSEEPLYVECQGRSSPATPTFQGMDEDCTDARRDSTNVYTLEPAGLSASGSCTHVNLDGKLHHCGNISTNAGDHPEPRYACPSSIIPPSANIDVGRVHPRRATLFSSAMRVKNSIAITRKPATGVAPVEEYMDMSPQQSISASTTSTSTDTSSTTTTTSCSIQQHYSQPGPVTIKPSTPECDVDPRETRGGAQAAAEQAASAQAAATEDEAGYTSMAGAKKTIECSGKLEAAPAQYRNLQPLLHVDHCRTIEPQPSLEYWNIEPHITISVTGHSPGRTASNAALMKCTLNRSPEHGHTNSSE